MLTRSELEAAVAGFPYDTRLQVQGHGSNGLRINGHFRWRRSSAVLQPNIYRSGPDGIWWCLDRRSISHLDLGMLQRWTRSESWILTAPSPIAKGW
jgi:hypothetical protein